MSSGSDSRHYRITTSAQSAPVGSSQMATMQYEKFWMNRSMYADAERRHYESLAKVMNEIIDHSCILAQFPPHVIYCDVILSAQTPNEQLFRFQLYKAFGSSIL